jgi:hypothetical protein
MRATFPSLAVAATAILVTGCATSSSGRDVPALIVDPTPESRAELKLAVQRALHSDPILLSDDALTRSSLLPIDRIPRRDIHGRLLNGMEIGHKPDMFHLVRNGKSCVLIHDDAAQSRQTLTATHCRQAPQNS